MTHVTTYTLRKGSPAKTRTDLVVIGVAKTSKGDLVACPGAEDVASEYGRKFKPMLSSMGFKGDTGEVLRVPTGGAIKAGQLLVVGVGKRDALTIERVRRAAGAGRPQRRQRRLAWRSPCPPTTPSTCAPSPTGSCWAATPSSATSRAPTTTASPTSRSSATPPDARTRSRRLDTARRSPTSCDQARDWVNTPPNDLTPAMFADGVVASQEARGAPSRRSRSRSSARRPGRARLRRHPRRRPGLGQPAAAGQADLGARRTRGRKVAFVGKGITFDSGGLTIKPGSSMATMKYDMGGAAAVIAATFAIAALELPGRRHDLRADGREHGRRARRCGRATS